MKRKLIIYLIVLLVLSNPVHSKKGDDKWAHMFMGAYIAEQGKDMKLDLLQNVLLVVCIGIIKENYDRHSTGYHNDDIAMNVVGVLFSYSIDLLPFMENGNSKETKEKKWEPQETKTLIKWEELSV